MARSGSSKTPNVSQRQPTIVRPSDHHRRLVVVGEDAARRVEPLLNDQDQIVRVLGFLPAMGEAAKKPVSAVIGPLSALSGMATSTAESLRRLAPHARLVVIQDADRPEEISALLDAGFDVTLLPTDSDLRFAEALNLPVKAKTVEPPATPDLQATPELRELDPDDLSTLDLHPADPEQPTSYEATLDAAMPNELSDPADPDTLAAPAADDAHLGDTDLVDLILRGEGGIAALALRMIRAQSGISDVQLLPPHYSVPPGRASAPVRQGDQNFGTLHAPPAPTAPVETAPNPGSGGSAVDSADYLNVTTQTLGIWADWLVRWLRLEAQFKRLRDLSMKDELTGAWNRRYFNRFLKKILSRAAEDRQQVTVLVFDIDNFKLYNDAYGHAAGDEILREVAKLMVGSVREHDVVARIGGDEFAVIFWDAGQQRRPHSKHPDDVLNAAKRFQRAVIDHRFPKLLDKAAGTLTISGGLAGFPWDGRTPEELVEFADTMAMRSKQQGKNAITFGPGARLDPDKEQPPSS